MSEEQITIAQMQKDIDYIKRDISELKSLLVELPQRLDDSVAMLTKEFDRREERYNSKYAPKAAWEIIVWAARIVGGIILTAAIYLIVKFGHLVL